MDEQTQSYIDSLYNESDVMELIASVNEKMEAACGKDSDLAAFIDQIRGRTGAQPATDIPTETASESQTAGQSETNAETETETESASETETEE